MLFPVALRNRALSGEWLLTTSQAGQNFYTGNNRGNPSGAYGTIPFVRGNPQFEEEDFRAEAERRLGRTLGYRELSWYWFRQALDELTADPAFARHVMLRKLALFWNDFEIPDSQDQYLIGRHCSVMRLPLPGFGWIAPFALFGATAFLRRKREARLLAAFVAVYCLSVAAFFVMSRYRIQVVAALLPLAAAGAMELTHRIRTLDPGPILRATILVVTAFLFCMQTIGIFSPRNELFIGMQLHRLGQAHLDAGDPQQALEVFRQAAESCPLHCPQALEDLASFFESTGRHAEAAAFYRGFFARHPGHPLAGTFLQRFPDGDRSPDADPPS